MKKAFSFFLGLVLALSCIPGAASATQSITFTQGGTVPAPYNAYDSANCSWRSGPNIDSNADGTRLIVADGNNYNCGGIPVNRYIYLSADGGATFTAASGLPSAAWGIVASSPTGQYLAAAAHQGNLYTSTDFGATWTLATTPGVKPWWEVKMSDDGSFMMATYDWSSVPYVSYNYGVTWSALTGFIGGSWRDIAVSADGKVVAICKNDGNATHNGARIFISRTGAVPTNFSSFTETLDRPASTSCGSLEMDAAGTRLASLTWSNDSVAIWRYSAATWSVVRQFTESWADGYIGISMSSDGQTIFMPGWDQRPDYISFDGGATSQYISVTDLPTRIGVATVSRDGSKLIEIGSDRAYISSLNVSISPPPAVIAPAPAVIATAPISHKVISLNPRTAITGQSVDMTLIGEDLEDATSVTVGGLKADVSSNSSSSIKFKSPSTLMPGKYDLKVVTPTLILTFTDALVVTEAPAKSIPAQVKSLTCIKGAKIIKVVGATPKCPTGYKKKG